MIANLKTLTTAGFSVMILGRSYSWAKWRALVLLVAGVILFVLPTLQVADENDEMIANNDYSGIALGIGAEVIVVTLSGYAAIHFEKAIKDDPFDIWERNFQLGVYSVLIYLGLFFTEGRSKPFSNWTPLACVLSVLGASGGLLIGKHRVEKRGQLMLGQPTLTFISLQSSFHQVWRCSFENTCYIRLHNLCQCG